MMHRGEAIRTLCRQHGHRLTLHRLPPYAPELNPVEQLNNDLKHGPDCLANHAHRSVLDLTTTAPPPPAASSTAPNEANQGCKASSKPAPSHEMNRHCGQDDQ
mgnify:CR=1 FL=1